MREDYLDNLTRKAHPDTCETTIGEWKMESINVGELKSRFSEVLERVRGGEEIIISYGKNRKRVAVIVPYSIYVPKKERELGLLKDKGECIIHHDFKITDEEMLSS